ncbi:CRE-Na+ channel, partial [Aphelenchoides avenae]
MDFDGLLLDMRVVIPDIDNDTAIDLVRFWLGGSGLENMDALQTFNRTYMDYVAGLYDRWSAGHDPQQFFDTMIKKHSFKCEELFNGCKLGGKSVDCCNMLFQPRPVMRRGMCYQTVRDVNQTEADDIGRLVLEMKQLPSITSPQYNYTQ